MSDLLSRPMIPTETSFEVHPGCRLRGELRVASDKSISHRAIILGALAEGTTVVENLLLGEDVVATIEAFRNMGVVIELDQTTRRVLIKGVGLHGLQAPARPLDMGNSGTAMRLLTGVLCGQRFASTLVGDQSLSIRPMGRILRPLELMGANIQSTGDGCAPLHIDPAADLKGIRYQSPVASAQVKSCLLLAGLYADGETRVQEPACSRDHSERMLRAFGARLECAPHWASVTAGGALRGRQIEVPADISSAAFFMVGASICPGSDVLLKSVGLNPTRSGIIDILASMGANLQLLNERSLGGEPVADIRVCHADLHSVDVSPYRVAAAIDEFPAVFVAAACADGKTTIRGASELRVKESDRIVVMCRALESLGIRVEELPDGAVIHGGQASGGVVASAGDHRCAMALSMLGMVASAPISIVACRNVATSYPDFVEHASSLGLQLKVKAA